MSEPLHLVLEFARAENAGQPHSFRFVAQSYLLRTSGGGFEAAEFPWSRGLLAEIEALRAMESSPERIQEIGGVLREFLAGAGWGAHEQAIVAAAQAGAPIHITIRSAAAELYVLPWELVALKTTGQLLGGIPGLVIRYEWPETRSFPDPVAAASRCGRVLFAWSAAGGAVPAAEHQSALRAALGARFEVERDVIANASFAAIADRLAQARREGPPIDALHLLCHGAAVGGSYGLVLDPQEAGDRVVVDAGRMQQLIAPHAGALRMVVVAACNSGNDGEPGNHLGSIAQMIHRAGVRGVVASRYPLSVAGSTRFVAALFAGLAEMDLERAFVAGREALVRDPGQMDWASVQLYVRAADGESWPLGRAEARVEPVTVPTSAPASVTRANRWVWLALAAVLVMVGVVVAMNMRGESPPSQPVEPAAKVETPTAPVIVEPPAPVAPEKDGPIEEPKAIEEPKPVEDAKPVVPGPGGKRTPVKPKPPVTPSTPSPDGCPTEILGYLKNGLPAPAAGGVRPELRVSVDVAGKLGYEVVGGAKTYADEASAKLPRLSSRLLTRCGAILPYELRLPR